MGLLCWEIGTEEKLKDKLSTGEKERKADSKQKTGRMKELDKEEEEKG